MIGITGQIGAGKSFVGQMLRGRGHKVLDADVTVHKLYRDDALLRQAISAQFGECALTADGVGRKFIADLIFRNPSARKQLEKLVYPALTRYILQENPDFVEAALFENVPEIVAALDEIWVVTAPAEVRLQRLTAPGRGLSPEDARRRMQLQSAKDRPEFWQELFPGKELRFIDNGGDCPPRI